jgi:hypothetical protein
MDQTSAGLQPLPEHLDEKPTVTNEIKDNSTGPVIDAIGRAHISLINAVRGCDVMLETADSEVMGLLQTTRQTNLRQVEELNNFLITQGRKPADDGSFMPMVRAAAVFEDTEGDLLPAVAEGERQLVSSYDDALEKLEEHKVHVSSDTFDAAQALLVAHRLELEDIVRTISSRHRALDD